MYRLFLALRYLRSRLVNLVSVGGVMFGVAVLIAVVSVMDGFQDRVRSTVRGNLSHLIMMPAPDTNPPPNWFVPFDKLEQELLAADDRIVACAPQVSMPIFFQYFSTRRSWVKGQNKALHQMMGVGVDWPREARVSSIASNLIAGNAKNPFYDKLAAKRGITTVLVGRTFAEGLLRLGEQNFVPYVKGLIKTRNGDPSNRIEMLYGTAEEKDGQYSFKQNSAVPMVKGVVDAKDSATGNRTLYFDIQQLRKMGGFEDEYMEVRIRLNDYESAPAVQKFLKERYPQYDVETWEDQKREFLQAVESEKIMLVVVLSFIVLLGGFIILATLMLTVAEKTRDIGILGALGATRSGILSVFLWNGLLIGIIGSILGGALGWWFVENVDLVRSAITWATDRDPFPANIYHFREVPTIWSWPTVLTIMAGSVIISFLAALLPAMRAARLDPIKALRHD